MRLYAKDYVTSGNLLAGFASALFAMNGNLLWAALMMPVAMFFDAFDGIVARVTRRYNKFGGEFDNVADHMSYGVAPAFLLYAAYEPVFREEVGLQRPLAIALAFLVGGVPIFFASLRFARFNTYHYKVPGYWLGVPRPATAFALAAMVNSHLFTAGGTQGRLACILLVLLLGGLNASTFPYLSHHHAGKTPWEVWFYYAVFATTTLLSIALGPVFGLVSNEYIGDTILFSMGCYCFFGWMEVPASARRMAREAVIAGESAEPTTDGRGNVEPVAGAAPTGVAAPTGKAALPSNVAAGISYLLGPLTGVPFLRGAYRDDVFVRFHAWQAIFAVIGVGVAYTGVTILHGMASELWPGFSLLRWVGIPMGVLFVGLWLVMMMSAFRGKKFHGPFVGSQAEKQLA
ncbi:MAG: CDP-alcohol phosphatidyltransferase family protein [Myxococcota bacterium]